MGDGEAGHGPHEADEERQQGQKGAKEGGLGSHETLLIRLRRVGFKTILTCPAPGSQPGAVGFC